VEEILGQSPSEESAAGVAVQWKCSSDPDWIKEAKLCEEVHTGHFEDSRGLEAAGWVLNLGRV
jgi:hypothetical protein